MNNRYSILQGFLTLLIIGVSCAQAAQLPAEEYKPKEGQPGKDVLWLPTPQVLTERMLDIAKVAPKDYVIDLGSGDGRLVIAAAKRGARSLGIEYNPDLVELSKRNAVREGVADKTNFVKADLFESDLSEATVITLFLGIDINLRLRPKLLALKPGTRVVSNTFTMAEWQPDEEIAVKRGCVLHCDAYLWIVPAKAGGTWRFLQGELLLRQSFQLISGTLKTGNENISITNGIMDGEQIYFTIAGTQYTGHVSDNTIDGGSWKATRTGAR